MEHHALEWREGDSYGLRIWDPWPVVLCLRVHGSSWSHVQDDGLQEDSPRGGVD